MAMVVPMSSGLGFGEESTSGPAPNMPSESNLLMALAEMAKQGRIQQGTAKAQPQSQSQPQPGKPRPGPTTVAKQIRTLKGSG